MQCFFSNDWPPNAASDIKHKTLNMNASTIKRNEGSLRGRKESRLLTGKEEDFPRNREAEKKFRSNPRK